jgi:YHS domain-containing protein
MKKTVFTFLLLTFFSIFNFAQNKTSEINLRSKHFNADKKGLAIQGYDPVSYFLGKAQLGVLNYFYKYNSITYQFASQKNLELFKTSPEKFEPEYGGWCAYAMGFNGEKVEINPKTYKIINGKLFLFYNSFFNNTLPKWNEDEKKLHSTADINWLKINK